MQDSQCSWLLQPFSRDPTFVTGCKFPFWLVLSSFYPVSCWSYQSYRSDFRTTQLDIKDDAFLEFPQINPMFRRVLCRFSLQRNGFFRFPCWTSSFLPAGCLVATEWPFETPALRLAHPTSTEVIDSLLWTSLSAPALPAWMPGAKQWRRSTWLWKTQGDLTKNSISVAKNMGHDGTWWCWIINSWSALLLDIPAFKILENRLSRRI